MMAFYGDSIERGAASWAVLALNIGLPTGQRFGDRSEHTAICKVATAEPVDLTVTGFVGDGVGSTKHHGGPDKAICVYSAAHYPRWAAELGFELPPAAFGENLTVAELDETELCIGDIFVLGSARVQVTQPRQPCLTLARRVGVDDFIKRVNDAHRPGFYLRVLTEGAVQVGDSLTLLEPDAHQVTVAYAHQVEHFGLDGGDGVARLLAVAALSASWRRALSRR